MRIYYRRSTNMFPYTPAYPDDRSRMRNTMPGIALSSVVTDRGRSIPSAVFKFSPRNMLNRTIKRYVTKRRMNEESKEYHILDKASVIKFLSKNDPVECRTL